MTELYEWAMQDASTYIGYVDMYMAADASGDGLMTWSELNAWLPGMLEAGLTEAQGDAILAFF